MADSSGEPTKETINWALEEYNQLCRRDRTDGSIFWNKITVLISVNFALFGILSIKKDSPDLILQVIILFSGLLFTSFWWIVIFRQSKWVDHWKEEIKKIEGKGTFKIKVQTQGDKFGDAMSCLKIGSYRHVSYVLPVFFLFLWIITLTCILIK
jgi:hypothetical protein